MTTQTPIPEELDAFESRLLAELRREVAATAAVEAAPAPVRTRRRALALAAGVAAAAVLGVVLVPGLGSTPAYSVQEGNAGEVVVEVNRPEDAAGLERALEEHGIAADVTYLPALRTCAPGRFDEVDREVGLSLAIGEDLVRVTLPPGAVREGETFVMALSVVPFTDEQIAEVSEREGQRVVDGASSSVSAEVASGPVGPCEAVRAR